VRRMNKGKRYCIIHAGCKYGWIGTPRVWPARYGGTGDYHENMNSTIFDAYFDELCRHCRDDLKLPRVVFVMDNAKYHRTEYRGYDQNIVLEQGSQQRHKTLSQLSKSELYQRLRSLNADVELLDKLNKKQLYDLAKTSNFKIPFSSEAIAEKYVIIERTK